MNRTYRASKMHGGKYIKDARTRPPVAGDAESKDATTILNFGLEQKRREQRKKKDLSRFGSRRHGEKGGGTGEGEGSTGANRPGICLQ